MRPDCLRSGSGAGLSTLVMARLVNVRLTATNESPKRGTTTGLLTPATSRSMRPLVISQVLHDRSRINCADEKFSLNLSLISLANAGGWFGTSCGPDDMGVNSRSTTWDGGPVTVAVNAPMVSTARTRMLVMASGLHMIVFLRIQDVEPLSRY